MGHLDKEGKVYNSHKVALVNMLNTSKPQEKEIKACTLHTLGK